MDTNKSKMTAEELAQRAIAEATQSNVLDIHQEDLDPNEILKNSIKEGMVFPLDAFPKEIIEIINNWTTAYKFPPDYYGLGVLVAASTAIGNNYLGEFRPGWSTSCILFGMIVGNSGVGKSKVINQCLAPLFDIQGEYKIQYDEARAAFEEEKKEDPKRKYSDDSIPLMKKIMTSVATTESLYKMMLANPRGVLLCRQELLGWIKGMNQYSKGGDGEFWLEVHDNETIMVDRVGVSMFIERFFANVFGGIQFKRISELAAESRGENGFIPRLLFAFPDDLKKPKLSDITADQRITKQYHKIIKNIDRMPSGIAIDEENPMRYTINSVVLKMSPEAQKIYKEFLDSNTDLQNAAQNDLERSIYAKMDSYALRFALILEIINISIRIPKADKLVIEDMEKEQITEDSINNALKLVGYFTNRALRVIQRFDGPVENLDPIWQAWYKSLPESFKTQDAYLKGDRVGRGRTQIKKYLNRKDLFIRRQVGFYEKRFI
jgi:hypothetical protein